MTASDGLPPLREVIERYDIAARKSLGQNFLLDLNLTGKIARSAGNLEDQTVLEVGPGPGGLTRALLSNGAKRVIAIEKDERCITALEAIAEIYPNQVEIIAGDALELQISNLGVQPTKIVANLPYNVATPLLTKWVAANHWPPVWNSMTLMFQKEVAERICAQPGDKQYGRLAVLCGWRTYATKLFDVSPQAFHPPPKVTSSIVHLEPRTDLLKCQVQKLETLTKHAFGQRRKMLRASLKPLGGESLVLKAGIDPKLRAEQVDVAGFVRLANLI